MSQVILPFNLQNDSEADADQVMANYTAITGVVNGSLQAGVNVAAGTPGPVSSGSSGGSSLSVARSDHTHSVQGVERLAGDPGSGNFLGREYFNTATLQKRLCVGLPATWLTTGNLAASDLPLHSARHSSGGADPLAPNSVDESMFAARTIYRGVPSADVVTTANGWNDIVTGLSVTVTGTQAALLMVNAAAVNLNGSNSPVVSYRVLDQSSAVLFQTGGHQMSTNGANNDQQPTNAVYPVTFSSSPTLKLQCNASLAGVTVRKTQTSNGSTFAVTSLAVIVG